MSLTDRENEIFAQVISGNVPAFQRNLVAVTNTEIVSSISYTYTYYVLPDYLAIGCDTNYFLCPMTPLLAQHIADVTGCTMPTRKMVNQIWSAAPVHLAPSTITASPQMITIPVMAQHNDTVWSQRSAILTAHPLGELVGGDKKDVVISNLIYGYSPSRVVIYGWHYTNGTPIQPLYNGHEETYADYSHGIRLVQMNMLLNGAQTSISTVLQSSTLNTLLSDEGSITVPRYPVFTPIVATPTSFAVVNKNATSLLLLASSQTDVTHFFVQTSNDGLTFPNTFCLHKDSLMLTGLTTNQPVYFRLAAISSYDTSAFSEVLGAIPSSCKAPVLIVNGFDRASAGNTLNFIRQHGGAFYTNGYGFVSSTNEALINGLVNANSYRIMDYILGDESTVNETFNNTEQTLVTDFLLQGGNLFVSGAEIAWDLDHMGSAADKNFYHNFLKAAYVNDAPNGQNGVYYQAQPSAGSIFTGLGQVSYDNGTHGTFNVDYPDVLSAQGSAVACMEYSSLTTNYAGVSYSGLFPGGSHPGKIINLGIPFETFYPENTRNVIMQYILNYFDVSPSGLNKPIITLSNDTLYSDWNGLQQWYYNGNPISGATSPYLVANFSGDYFVIAENDSCYSDTSDIKQVLLTNLISQKQKDFSIKSYPNPFTAFLHIDILHESDFVCTISIWNVTGQLMLLQKTGFSTDINTYKLPAGIYLLTVEENGIIYRERIVKE